jgi:hypothetical protein
MTVQIKWKAMTFQEKHNVIQKVEANPNTTVFRCLCYFYTDFRWSIMTGVQLIFLCPKVKESSGVATLFPSCSDNVRLYIFLF